MIGTLNQSLSDIDDLAVKRIEIPDSEISGTTAPTVYEEMTAYVFKNILNAQERIFSYVITESSSIGFTLIGCKQNNTNGRFLALRGTNTDAYAILVRNSGNDVTSNSLI